VVPIPKYPKSVLKRSGNSVFGAAGIGILAFHLLDPVTLSAGREFHKIVARFYFYNQMNQGVNMAEKKNQTHNVGAPVADFIM
jgi:hypothetical protein